MTELSPQLREIASWRIVAELTRRYPGRFTIIETHPGGGQYDCLSIYERGDPHDGGHIDLNRVGSMHVLRPFGPSGASSSWGSFWNDLAAADDPKRILDELCGRAGLPSVTQVPSAQPDGLACRFIATFLGHAAFGRTRWECRNAVHDTSGEGGGFSRAVFDPFPAARVAADHTSGDDLLGEPGYRFWFLVHDGFRLCVEMPTGTAFDLAGNVYDLAGLYRRHRRIWPLVHLIAGDLLP